MRIAILSDTHNRIDPLKRAVEVLKSNGISTIFHCGDVTTTETALWMAGFKVHYAFGNGDFEANAIRDLFITANPGSSGGMVVEEAIDGISIAATHGHLAGKVTALAASGAYDYVFHGHTHMQKDEMLGQTRIINPGALGSSRYNTRTLCILDLQTGQCEFPIFV